MSPEGEIYHGGVSLGLTQPLPPELELEPQPSNSVSSRTLEPELELTTSDSPVFSPRASTGPGLANAKFAHNPARHDDRMG